MARINLKDAVFSIKDGTTPTANSITVKVGDGALNYSEQRNLDYELDRGNLDSVKVGDDAPVEVNFDFVWEEIQAVGASGTPTVEDALKKRGEAASWASTDSDACNPYAVDLEIVHTPPECTSKQVETVLLSDFRWDRIDHDYPNAQVSVTGRCNVVEATVTRSAQA